jgi:monothiol glutaredoxin
MPNSFGCCLFAFAVAQEFGCGTRQEGHMEPGSLSIGTQRHRLQFAGTCILVTIPMPSKEPDMSRSILDEAHIHPAIRGKISGNHTDVVREVQAAIAAHPVVVVGMAQNPFPRKARKALDAIGTPYQYLEYGSYLSGWRRRNALKMWTGWPTFPMVFVNGMLVGGASELQWLIDNGEFPRLLAGR